MPGRFVAITVVIAIAIATAIAILLVSGTFFESLGLKHFGLELIQLGHGIIVSMLFG
jgi:hypothetical protein